RRLAGRELNDGLPGRLAGKIIRRTLAAEEFQTYPAPAPARPRLQLASLFGDGKDPQPYHRLEIGHHAAIRTRNQHVANLVSKGDANLFDARVVSARRAVRAPHQLQLFSQVAFRGR